MKSCSTESLWQTEEPIFWFCSPSCLGHHGQICVSHPAAMAARALIIDQGPCSSYRHRQLSAHPLPGHAPTKQSSAKALEPAPREVTHPCCHCSTAVRHNTIPCAQCHGPARAALARIALHRSLLHTYGEPTRFPNFHTRSPSLSLISPLFKSNFPLGGQLWEQNVWCSKRVPQWDLCEQAAG